MLRFHLHPPALNTKMELLQKMNQNPFPPTARTEIAPKLFAKMANVRREISKSEEPFQ